MKKKTKRASYNSNDSYDVKRFIIVLLIVVLAVVAVYFLTRIFVTKDLFNKEEETVTETSINYNLTTVGLLLSRPYDEYYVFLYNDESKSQIVSDVRNVVTKYTNSEDAKKVYYVDLEEANNIEFYSAEDSNPNASSVKDFKFGNATVLKVKDGKIVKYLEKLDAIEKELKVKEASK